MGIQRKIDNVDNRKLIELGDFLSIAELVSIAREGAEVTFSDEYKNRVNKARSCVENWVEDGRVMYGITTGFGALSTTVISKENVEILQKNILLSHSTSVGNPLSEEVVRAIMVVMLQNMGSGYAGVRLELLEHIKAFLNLGITPYAPGDGSVGYLSVEAHIGLAFIGLGKAYYQGKLYETSEIYEKLNLKPIKLAEKEGLSMISGTSSPTGMGALAIHDMYKASLSADVISAMNLEVAKGTIKAFDKRLMSVKPYKEQLNTAGNVRRILEDSEIIKANENYRLQDALSLRAIPQLHGASKRTIMDAMRTIEEELNYCADNPIIWSEDDGEALSGTHCDSSYVGLEMDSASIASTMIAKMSERRNYRLLTSTFSGYPWFLIKNPGVNSGLMIPQYTQAGLINEMRVLAHPAVIDNTPTCGGQEDYVAMGYYAAKKSMDIADKLEYILAIELLSVYQAYSFIEEDLSPGSVSKALNEKIGTVVPELKEDQFLHPYIEELKRLIHSGELVGITESVIGALY